MTDKYDLVVVGQGAAAFAAVIRASELRAQIAMVGSNATSGARLGGTCVNVGCVPSKRLLVAGEIYRFRDPGFAGVTLGKNSVDFRAVIREKDALIRRLRREKYANVLRDLDGLTFFDEMGSFVSPKRLRVNGSSVIGEKFIIATGASTYVPPIAGIREVGYLTNETALSPTEIPDSMVIVGGGPLGLEFAQMYNRFGTKVTIVQHGERILPREEPEVSQLMHEILSEEGVKILTEASPTRAAKKGAEKVLSISVNSRKQELRAREILLASGRRPNTSILNLEAAHVKTDERGFVVIDDEMRTSNPRIYAAGDVSGEPMLETVAAKEGATAAENAVKGTRRKIDYLAVPHAVFTYPQVASVGLTEEKVVEAGYECACRTIMLDDIPKAQIINEKRGLVKLVADGKTKRILGLHIVAPYAAEMIHTASLAVKGKMTVDDLIDTVFTFPTLSEGIKMAAQSFYKDVTKLSCCIE